MPDEDKIIADAIRIEEQLFQVNDYQGLQQTPPYTVLTGEMPVLLSAPHAVKHFRRANNEPKEEDEFTGSLVRLLHGLTGCHVIHAVTSDLDPNFYDDCPYKDGLRSLVQEHGIRLVVDIHGAAAWRAFDVDIGTCKGVSLLGRDDLLAALKQALRDGGGISALYVDNVFTGCGQATVTRFSSEVLRVPAVQLEINRRFRDPQNHPLAFQALVKALRDYLTAIKEAHLLD